MPVQHMHDKTAQHYRAHGKRREGATILEGGLNLADAMVTFRALELQLPMVGRGQLLYPQHSGTCCLLLLAPCAIAFRQRTQLPSVASEGSDIPNSAVA